MIYNLTHEFTMLEQTEGLMQNMTLHTPIELVTCQEKPLKDSGIALMPLEKMKFATCENERIYARCTKLDGTIATLSVVNIQSAVKCNAHKEASGKKLGFVPRMKKFDVAGTYDWAVPETGWYKVTVIGSGGGGGNCSISTAVSAENLIYVAVSSGSGGGGGTAIKNVYLEKGEIIPIVVGAGGKQPDIETSSLNHLYNGGANNGQSSSFGAYCSATGGFGGETRLNQTYAWQCWCRDGGKGMNGDLNINGESGHHCGMGVIKSDIKGVTAYAPCGGSSFLGKAKMSWSGVETRDGDSGVYGSGGGGARVNREATLRHGGKGGDGVVLIEWTEVQGE